MALYLNYELFHFCCHVKDDRVVRHIPLVNSIRRHHIAHHNPAIMMERNFNLTYPVADWFFGTSDLALRAGPAHFQRDGHAFRAADLKRVRAGRDDPRIGHVARGGGAGAVAAAVPGGEDQARAGEPDRGGGDRGLRVGVVDGGGGEFGGGGAWARLLGVLAGAGVAVWVRVADL